MSSKTSTQDSTKRSARKPFAVGTRVARQVDGERGTVESVRAYTFEGDPTWAVAVRTDSDNEVWSGTQKTRAVGAWRALTADELAELDPAKRAQAISELDENAHPWDEFAIASGAMDDALSVEAAKSAQRDDDAIFGGSAGIADKNARDDERAEMLRPLCGERVKLTLTDGTTLLGPLSFSETRTTTSTHFQKHDPMTVNLFSVETTRGKRTFAAGIVADARRAPLAGTASQHKSAETRALRRAQRASCDFYGCAQHATTTRELAGQTWNVCGAHA